MGKNGQQIAKSPSGSSCLVGVDSGCLSSQPTQAACSASIAWMTSCRDAFRDTDGLQRGERSTPAERPLPMNRKHIRTRQLKTESWLAQKDHEWERERQRVMGESLLARPCSSCSWSMSTACTLSEVEMKQHVYDPKAASRNLWFRRFRPFSEL